MTDEFIDMDGKPFTPLEARAAVSFMRALAKYGSAKPKRGRPVGKNKEIAVKQLFTDYVFVERQILRGSDKTNACKLLSRNGLPASWRTLLRRYEQAKKFFTMTKTIAGVDLHIMFEYAREKNIGEDKFHPALRELYKRPPPWFMVPNPTRRSVNKLHGI